MRKVGGRGGPCGLAHISEVADGFAADIHGQFRAGQGAHLELTATFTGSVQCDGCPLATVCAAKAAGNGRGLCRPAATAGSAAITCPLVTAPVIYVGMQQAVEGSAATPLTVYIWASDKCV
jgi:hypothetical protein